MQFTIWGYLTALDNQGGYMSSNNIYSTQVKPYVYMCTHKKSKQFYIGYREQNVVLNRTSSTDLPVYKTSSKVVRPIFDQFDWQIVAEFFTGIDAFNFEQQLILENWGNPLMLNKQYRLPSGEVAFKSQKGCNKGRKNPFLSERNKTVVPWNKGLTKEDPRVASYTKPKSQKFKEIVSSAKKEWHKVHSVAGANNPMFGVVRERFVCKHCGKDADIANYKRWHGDKCKNFSSD